MNGDVKNSKQTNRFINLFIFVILEKQSEPYETSTLYLSGIAGQTTANQQALHAHLFTSYDSGEKPYCGGAVNVTLDLALRQVIDLVNSPSVSVFVLLHRRRLSGSKFN